MTREEMMDKVIKVFGFEDKNTIWFCELCEDISLSEEVLFSAMIATLVQPIGREER